MIQHVFKYRLKCILNDKQMMFWTLLFPIILSTLFGTALSNLSSADKFSNIPIAVVDNAKYQNDKYFQSALTSVSESSNKDRLFTVTVTTKENADNLLKNSKIDGYILLDDKTNVIVKDSGIHQTILKSFADDYLQVGSAYATIHAKDPSAIQKLMADSNASTNILKDVAPGKAKPNILIIYYYALIAMACLYGGFHGMNEVLAVQADMTPQGARVNIVPVHKLKIFGISLVTATFVQFISILITIAYMSFAMKVDFGGNLPYVLLASLVGCMTGVSFGAMVTTTVKRSEGIKSAILIVVTMVLSYMSGLMNANVKYEVTNAVPALAYINPANLIADAFYSLYYFDTYTRYFINIGLLFGFSLVFYLITYFVMRRQKYASI